MKTVLIVDDEKLFLASLTEGLATHNCDFQVITASDGKQAVDIINSQPVDLIVTDLKMPVMDGFQLIAHLVNADFNLPVIVMTAFGTPEIEIQLNDLYTLGYLEKPIDFQKLIDKISDGLSQTEKGHLSGISLLSFLQLIQMDQKTCSVKVKQLGREGTLVFSKGELFDAMSGKLKGEAAALEIICWEDAEIEILNIFKKAKRSIHRSLLSILIEADEVKNGADPHDGIEPPALLLENQKDSPIRHLQFTESDLQEANQDHQKSKSTPSAERAENGSNKNKIIKETKKAMANNVNESLNELMDIEGAKAVALVDGESGMPLGTAGGGINLEIAAAGNSEVVRAKHKTMSNLGIKDSIEDILISLGEQYHLIRPLKAHGNLFFYLVLSRANANLAMARFKLSDVEGKVQV